MPTFTEAFLRGRAAAQLRGAMLLIAALTAPGLAPAATEPDPGPVFEIESFVSAGAAGVLEFPPGAPGRATPAVLILHDAVGVDGRSGVYVAQLLGAGIAVLDLEIDEPGGVAAALAALAAHPRVAGRPVGVLGFGAGARLAASLSAAMPARALLYPGCANLLPRARSGEALLLLTGAADATNPPDACAAAAARLAEGGAKVHQRAYPGAGYAWDYPRFSLDAPLLLPAPDGAGRVVVHPWPDLAALSAAEVASFFAAHLHRGPP